MLFSYRTYCSIFTSTEIRPSLSPSSRLTRSPCRASLGLTGFSFLLPLRWVRLFSPRSEPQWAKRKMIRNSYSDDFMIFGTRQACRDRHFALGQRMIFYFLSLWCTSKVDKADTLTLSERYQWTSCSLQLHCQQIHCKGSPSFTEPSCHLV